MNRLLVSFDTVNLDVEKFEFLLTKKSWHIGTGAIKAEGNRFFGITYNTEPTSAYVTTRFLTFYQS